MKIIFRLFRFFAVILSLILIFCLAYIFIPGADTMFSVSGGSGKTGYTSYTNTALPSTASGNITPNRIVNPGTYNTGDEYFLTAKEVMAMENISLMDKLKGLTLLSKLNRDVIDKIYNMASDGLTYKEMDDVRSLLGRYLSSSEIEKLNELLVKNKNLYAQGELASK
ncbi:MAG: hypothetical protein Q8920_03530 [Bacillota bacterium]|nr:hypothetical protein [Bacillota bacterium]